MRWQRRLAVNRIADKLWWGSDAMQARVDPSLLPSCQFHLLYGESTTAVRAGIPGARDAGAELGFRAVALLVLLP